MATLTLDLPSNFPLTEIRTIAKFMCDNKTATMLVNGLEIKDLSQSKSSIPDAATDPERWAEWKKTNGIGRGRTNQS